MRLISVSFVWALCLLAAGALAFAAAMNGAGGAEAQSNDPDIQLRSRAADAVLGGDPIEISLAIAHSIGREETLETDLIIVAPYDWSIAGEGFAEPCSTGICNGAYRVEPGERRDVEIRITPTDAGEFTVSAKAAWRLEDGSRSGTQQLEFKVSVRDPSAIGDSGGSRAWNFLRSIIRLEDLSAVWHLVSIVCGIFIAVNIFFNDRQDSSFFVIIFTLFVCGVIGWLLHSLSAEPVNTIPGVVAGVSAFAISLIGLIIGRRL